jgi:hypothetical protein
MQKRHLLRGFSFLIALALLFFKDSSISSAFLGGDNFKQTFPEKLNLLILVKASQSSNHQLSDLSYSKTKLEIIQDSILLVLKEHSLPPNVNLGIMAYGHIIDRTVVLNSCSPDNVELVVPTQPASPNINLEKFLTISGLGEVPTAVALEEAGKLFTQTSPEILNVILLIADGSDTCGQDPEEKARELANSKNIVIYTIGFMADTKASKELKNIADQASGTFYFISPYIGKNEVAKDELTRALSSAFDKLLTQISIPTQTNTPVSTVEVSLTPTPSDVSATAPIPFPTEATTQVIPENTLPGPISTEEPPFSPIRTFGLFFMAAILFLGILGFGFWIWKSQKTAKVLGQTTAAESTITVDERLEQFRKDLYKAYATIEAKKHYTKYIELALVKAKLSSIYNGEQFDELLTKARRKYPDKIWIDRDRGQPVFIKIVQK